MIYNLLPGTSMYTWRTKLPTTNQIHVHVYQEF